MPEPAIPVLIVDDHAVVREGIASLLAACHDITVVGAVGSIGEALEVCARLEVAVVLMDLSMPDVDGVSGTRMVLERYPELRVVVLTGYVEDAAVRAAVEAGASACLLKTVGMDELADAIRGVTQGRSTFSSEFLPHLVGQEHGKGPEVELTTREHDILTLMAAGNTNKGIARSLGLTEGTVRVYVSAILTKLGVTNRTEATVRAIREGLVGQNH